MAERRVRASTAVVPPNLGDLGCRRPFSAVYVENELDERRDEIANILE